MNTHQLKQPADVVANQQRNALWITLVTFVVMLLISIVAITIVPAEEKTPIDNYLMPLMALGALYSHLLTRRGKHVRGIYLLLGMIITASVLYPFVANNIGWQAAIGMLLITTGIANGTLPEKIVNRITVMVFVFAILVVLLEIFVTGITSIAVNTSAIVVVGFLVVVYLGVILYQFQFYALRTKIVISFILISILAVGSVSIVINRIIANQLTEQVSDRLINVSNNVSESISQELINQINLLQTLSFDTTIKNVLTESLTNLDIAEIERLDTQWRNAVSGNNLSNSLIRNVLENETSNKLLEFQERFIYHEEIFITDVNGVNIASTGVTSDYYQADEEWWQAAYNSGNGDIYISQPIFDESTQSLSIQLAIPIFDVENKKIVGILRSTLNLEIFHDALELSLFGETGRAEIHTPDLRELELLIQANNQRKIEVEDLEQSFFEELNSNEGLLTTPHDGAIVLLRQVLFSDLESTDAVSAKVKELNWRIVTIQDRDEALKTVEEVSRTSQLIGLSAFGVATLLALLLTQYLTQPIVRLTNTAEQISSGNYQARAQAETQDEIGALATSFNKMTEQLSESLSTLEQRVAERTVDLEFARDQSEKRTNQLIAVSEISKFLNTEQKLDVLLSLITRLVSEDFGFYHVGIFLVDDQKQFAILQSSNSEGGQTMLKRGYRLKIGNESIVGNVAQTGNPRIALDVGLDAVNFNNPDLPKTRSEIALPLKSQNVVIGVLDVQSEKPNAFTSDDSTTLSILADQIAISIDNARLFSQTQQALFEVQTLYRQNLQEGWKSFTRDEDVVGYIHSASGGKKLTETIGTIEIQQALNRGETVVTDANNQSSESTLAIPIKLRGQVIGVMRVQSPTLNRKWTANEINLTEAISERLSLALENARLLQESQRQVIKEQTISEITSHIGSSINLDNVLRTAIEELGRSIPGSEVIIKLQEEKANGATG